METWLTYSPEDFLLFSEPVYWRLFELHNAALWPAQFAALLAGIAVLILLHRRPTWAGRAIAAILALAWAVSGLVFLTRYATINWLATDLVPVFLVQAALLAFLGGYLNAIRPAETTNPVGFAICAYGMFLHPFVALADGRPPAGAELFALTPDPTAIVTLGVLVMVRGNLAVRLLGVLPLFWCFASWATLATLGTWEAWILPVAVLATLLSTLLPSCRA
ncbi:DUF6064 family protein [Nisaea acidiphila]|uniref:DUF6064 family protein n=1 Tax=Nisaea acidiphila TaxID=1862145 RepID=A0A9J7AMU0_9PROT|nr:DUF6064 family protein [Nisaea acidiphila]UUX48963.1 DUF6064 family protein [Nisaea acidiphila]